MTAFFSPAGTRCARRLLPLLVLAASVMALMSTTAAAQRRTCVDCHKDFKDHLKKKFVHEPVEDGCDSCHKRHGFTQKLVLTKRMPELCTDCHEDVKEEIGSGNVHQALSEGGCTVCHEPHASDEKGLLRGGEAGDSGCLLCHDGLAAMFDSDDAHPPFTDGECAACHEPHSSQFPSLLVSGQDTMCESCHEGAAANHSVPGLADFACSACHDPHGSSKKKPLSAVAHEPFAEGDCETCHELADDGEVDLGDDFPAADLCADCHDDAADVVAGGESHFGADALARGGTETCLRCHDPHQSGLPAMLAATENELCRGCHESLPNIGTHKGSMHQPFLEGSCTECHEPHGGGGPNHLAKAGREICIACHDAVLDRSDDQILHEALETAECVDCHSGHATGNYALLTESVAATCESCHDKEQHPETHPPYLTSSCDACHRNHSPRPALLPASVNDTCGRCHRNQIRALFAAVEHPPAKEEDCLFCHQAHGSEAEGLLTDVQSELCSDCHDLDDLAVGADPASSGGGSVTVEFHTPIAQGSCEGCHNPHGSVLGSLLNREGEDLCYGCHTEEKVTFAENNPHRPVAEGECDRCHTPHGSVYGNLALESEPDLCLECHDVKRDKIVASHEGFDLSDARCASCHTPHSSPNEGLIKPVVHEPFADRDCGSCHDGADNSAPVMVAAAAEACVVCHDDKEEDRGHQHVAGIECADCHQPHAAKLEIMMDDPTAPCLGCHDDVLEPEGWGDRTIHFHKPIEDGSCLGCHRMHEPASSSYLARNQLDLCSSCHESIEARSSDKTQHAPFKKGECSKCHATHASGEPHLLATSESELCVSCHDLASAKIKNAHPTVPLTGSNCSSCHDPHGTTAAASVLILPDLHPPYEDKECDTCHEPSGKVTASVAVCADCHDSDNDFATVHSAGRPQDTAASMVVCTDCHSPHAGHDALLTRTSQEETCLQCHDRSRFTKKFVHGALEEGCTTCHEVHDNNISDLRGTAVDELCATCHDTAEMHAHPVGSEYQDPRSGRPMNCVSCHDVHSSDYDRLTMFDRNRDLCVQCHAAGTMQVR